MKKQHISITSQISQQSAVNPNKPLRLDQIAISLFSLLDGDSSKSTKLQSLVTTLTASLPSKKHFPKSRYSATGYDQNDNRNEIAGIATQLVQKIFYSFTYMSQQFSFTQTIFGFQPTSKQLAMKHMLFANASAFQFTKLGACSYRACYSAIKLREVLPDNIQVDVVSFPECDQFVVRLIDESGSALIYDPLTNPNVVFSNNHYLNHILPSFSMVNHVGHQFEFTVSRQIATEYQQTWHNKIQLKMQEMIDKIDSQPLALSKLAAIQFTIHELRLEPVRATQVLNAVSDLMQHIKHDQENMWSLPEPEVQRTSRSQQSGRKEFEYTPLTPI